MGSPKHGLSSRTLNWMKKSAVAVLHARLRKPTHTGPAEPRPINMWASTCGPLSNRCSLHSHRKLVVACIRRAGAQRTLHAVSKVYARSTVHRTHVLTCTHYYEYKSCFNCAK